DVVNKTSGKKFGRSGDGGGVSFIERRGEVEFLLGFKGFYKFILLQGFSTVSCNISTACKSAVTTEEKTQKRNDVKARSILLMALPNEHQLTFNQYKDAKTLFEAIQLRFDGNDATKKTHKTLLKRTYDNFKASRSESLDSISNRASKDWSQNVAFVSAPSCTNEDTAYIQVSIASTTVSAASTNDSVASLSDAIVYAFLANQPSGSQIVYKDLEQIHDDDLEESILNGS
ncbi:hypothetical protein Tco_0958933, partial [Tanacetum coccineum]